MDVTIDEAYNIVKKHDIDSNVDHHIENSDDPATVLKDSLSTMRNHPEYYNVSIECPILTFNKFVRAMKTYNYYIQNKKAWNSYGLFMVWMPIANDLLFFRTQEQMDHFMQAPLNKKSKETFNKLSAEANVKDITLYTKAFEIEYKDGETQVIYFDSIKGHDDL